MLFVIPWGRHWIIGTTDTDWHLGQGAPGGVRARDIDYLLEHVNAVLATPLTREDVEGVYAGLRPLLAGESESTSKLSREHIVGHPVPGLVVVAGGKYTTYRVMAKDAVDAVGARPGRQGAGVRAPTGCRWSAPRATRALWNARHADWRPGTGLHVARIEHLLAPVRLAGRTRCSTLIDDRPVAGRAAAEGADDYLRAEIVYAATHEGARHLDDVLTRRTRISIETFDRGVAAAPVRRRPDGRRCSAGARSRSRREVEHYLARVEAERLSQEQPDDETADSGPARAPRRSCPSTAERAPERLGGRFLGGFEVGGRDGGWLGRGCGWGERRGRRRPGRRHHDVEDRRVVGQADDHAADRAAERHADVPERGERADRAALLEGGVG